MYKTNFIIKTSKSVITDPAFKMDAYQKQKMKAEKSIKQSQKMMAAWLKRKVPQEEKMETSDDQMIGDDIINNFKNADQSLENVEITKMETMYPMFYEPETILSEFLFENLSTEIDCNNPSTWPTIIDDNFRNFLIRNGVDHGKNCDFAQSVDNDGRRFTNHWFTQKLKNGETVDRKWLMYSGGTKKIYCFPCMLFYKPHHKKIKLANPKAGYNNWRYLYTGIGEHENSAEHKNNYLHWVELERRNDELLAQVYERENWRTILKVVLDVVLLCAKNNLSLNGQSDQIIETGHFLPIIKLVSLYHPNLEEYIQNHALGAVDYLSNQVVDELINVLGNKVRNTIIEKIKVAKYYGIQFYESTTFALDGQMSLVLRYVDIDEDKVFVRESFVDFIVTNEKTEKAVANEMLTKLSVNGLDIRNARGQTYDKPNIILQAHILQENPFAQNVPSCLGTFAKNTAKNNPFMLTFFEIVHEIFVFFSSSARRWEILMSALKIILQCHNETSWPTKAKVVEALNRRIVEVCAGLKQIENSSADVETQYKVNNLLKQVDFKFLICLSYWDLILSCVDINDNKKAEIINIATQNSKKLNVSDDFVDKQLFLKQIDGICKIVYENLKTRAEEIARINKDFEFLTTERLIYANLSEIEKAAHNLSLKYNCDLNAIDLCMEIISFKHQVAEYFEQQYPDPQELLQYIYDFDEKDSFPNIEIALRLFLTMPLPSDKLFGKSKLIKNFLRSKLGQDKWPNLSVLSIEIDLAEKINFDDVINDFRASKE